MSSIVDKNHKRASGQLKEVLAVYAEAEDLINIGAYKKGTNPKIDFAVSKMDDVLAFLKQDTEERFSFEEELQQLLDLFPNESE